MAEPASVPVIDNPENPPGGRQVLTAELEWSFGAAEEDPLLGLVNQIVRDDRGNTYLLDTQLCQIHVLDAGGNLLRTFGREGDGPGELRRPQGMIRLGNDRIAVSQPMPPRFVVFTLDGEIRDDLDLPHEGMTQMVLEGDMRDGTTVLEQQDLLLDSGGVKTISRLLRLGDEDDVELTYLEHERSQDFQHPTMGVVDEENFSHKWALMADDRVVVAPRYHDYELEILGSDGKVERIFRRQAAPVPQNPDAVANIRARVEQSAERRGIDVDYDPDPYLPAIVRVLARANGEIWVQPSTTVDARSHAPVGPYDVFDSQGHFLRTVSIESTANSSRDRTILIGDHLMVIREFQDAQDSYMSNIMPEGGDSEENEEEPAPLRVDSYRLVPQS